jgi:hypothetical protein
MSSLTTAATPSANSGWTAGAGASCAKAAMGMPDVARAMTETVARILPVTLSVESKFVVPIVQVRQRKSALCGEGHRL